MMEDEVVRRRALADARAVPRPARRDEPDPGPELDRDGDPHRPRARAAGRASSSPACASSCPAVADRRARSPGRTSRYGALPEVGGVLYGVKPVIIAIVVQALWGLGRTRDRRRLGWRRRGVARWPRALARRRRAGRARRGGLRSSLSRRAARARAAQCRRVAAAGRARWPGARRDRGARPRSGSGRCSCSSSRSARCCSAAATCCSRSCAPISSSGCTGSPSRSCSTPSRSARSRPGPVFTTATFIGYVLGGPPGARSRRSASSCRRSCSSRSSGPLVPRLRRSPTAGAFLDGVNVASLALMAAVTMLLGRAAIVDVADRDSRGGERGAPDPVSRQLGVARARRRTRGPLPELADSGRHL